MKAAIAQIRCTPGEIRINCRKIGQFASRAAEQDCDLVVFPEMSDTGYDTQSIAATAGAWPGPAFTAVQETAVKLKITLVCGLSEREQNVIYNSLAVFGPDGALLAKYRKIHLFPGPPSYENRYLVPGFAPSCALIGGFKIGLMICYDIRFPELSRALVGSGANALICCAAWPMVRARHWKLLVKARALENRCYMLASNRVGSDGPHPFCGASAVADPDACLRVRGTTDKEQLLITQIDEGRVAKARQNIPSLPPPPCDLPPPAPAQAVF